VPPSGETVLIDTGNTGAEPAVRDAERIVAAAKDGRDHPDRPSNHHTLARRPLRGMAEVNKRIPIKHYIDHGGTVQPQPASTEFLEKVYPGLLAAAKHTVVKPATPLRSKGSTGAS